MDTLAGFSCTSKTSFISSRIFAHAPIQSIYVSVVYLSIYSVAVYLAVVHGKNPFIPPDFAIDLSSLVNEWSTCRLLNRCIQHKVKVTLFANRILVSDDEMRSP